MCTTVVCIVYMYNNSACAYIYTCIYYSAYMCHYSMHVCAYVCMFMFTTVHVQLCVYMYSGVCVSMHAFSD